MGVRVRVTLCKRLKAVGWLTPNTVTSQMYYRRDNRLQDQFRSAASGEVTQILRDMKDQNHKSHVPGDWRVRWLLTKPLSEDGTRAELELEEFFAESEDA